MSYGLDFTEVRYETDHQGNRLKATIPYVMFSALTEFWIAARRAQTAKLEAGTRPGQYKGSLHGAQSPPDDPPAQVSPPVSQNATSAFPNDRHWQNLVSRMPAEPPPAPPAEAQPESALPEAQSKPAFSAETKPKADRVFYREFMQHPPTGVASLVRKGTYFLRAWREHRGLTLKDAAELVGLNSTTILWHEAGRSVPTIRTLEKFAQAYDVPILQLTPKPGTDDSPFIPKQRAKAEPKAVTARATKPKANGAKRASPVEPLSPAGTAYPDGVLNSLLEGKSPTLAWRLYRGMTLAQLAEQYGGRAGNVKTMESQSSLRPATIDKLCKVFRCRPEQMLRPADLEARRHAKPLSDDTDVESAPAPETSMPITPREHRLEPAKSSIVAAFEQARSIDNAPRDARQRARARTRVQKELADL